ncbi:uncharacterized protein LOC117084546 [Trachypithecus francoisi]|uniref:uncharacterized protein LOC117084546 n=1 Tax=Trachypithecus francoisi TaxID=54180 RepID=UPI00141BA1B3|nr:uncharacterized protein LOC117084546 [Trachypithecus francoisi]
MLLESKLLMLPSGYSDNVTESGISRLKNWSNENVNSDCQGINISRDGNYNHTDKFSLALHRKWGQACPERPHHNADPRSLEASLQLLSSAVGAGAEHGGKAGESLVPGPWLFGQGLGEAAPDKEDRSPPRGGGPQLPPCPPPLRSVGLTASAARKLPSPSCTTTSFLVSPPAPPRAATSATALPVTLARRPQRPASSHPFSRPTREPALTGGGRGQISVRARARETCRGYGGLECDEERHDEAAADWWSAFRGKAEQRELWRRGKMDRWFPEACSYCIRMISPRGENLTSSGPVAQWITRLTTDQKILGSTPGWLAVLVLPHLHVLQDLGKEPGVVRGGSQTAERPVGNDAPEKSVNGVYLDKHTWKSSSLEWALLWLDDAKAHLRQQFWPFLAMEQKPPW